jgi:MraZ protein
VFLGEHQHTLDAKGRVSLPAKFRLQMTGKVVVAKGLDKNLYVYEAAEYEKFVSRLTAREDFNANVRKLRSFFTGGAEEFDLDSAGRVSIPANLREFAGLEKDLVVIGNGTRIEIWDAVAWKRYNAEAAESIDDIAQELADAGLL